MDILQGEIQGGIFIYMHSTIWSISFHNSSLSCPSSLLLCSLPDLPSIYMGPTPFPFFLPYFTLASIIRTDNFATFFVIKLLFNSTGEFLKRIRNNNIPHPDMGQVCKQESKNSFRQNLEEEGILFLLHYTVYIL